MKSLILITLLTSIAVTAAQAQTATCKPLAAPLQPTGGVGTTYKRPFHMGFVHFPHSTTTECGDPMETNLYYNTNFGDIMTIHEDGFIPYADAFKRFTQPGLTNWPSQYNANYQWEIYYNAMRRYRLPSTHKVILYSNHMNFYKDSLAEERTYDPATGAMIKRPVPTSDRFKFNDDYYVYAFISHLAYLIDAYRPDYVAFGTENNMLLTKIVETAATPDPSDDIPYQAWIDYVEASKRIYTILKSVYPDKKFYFTLQIDHPNSVDPATKKPFTYDFGSSLALYEVLKKAINYTKSTHLATRYITAKTWHYENIKMAQSALDVVAISTYPFMTYNTNVAGIPADYFSSIRAVAPTKPFAVAETGYIAEPLVFPDPINGAQVTIPGDQISQYQYVARLMSEGYTQKALFFNWYIVRDYDDMWNQVLQYVPQDRNISRIWRDIGLFDGQGNMRLAGMLWNMYLWRGVQQ